MKKVTTLVLMLCLSLSAALSYAHSAARTKNEKGIPIGIIEATTVSGLPRGDAILPILDGHVLTVVFTENLGQVAVEVTTALGGQVDSTSTLTPNGIQIYIPLAGDYIVTFTLPNGDVYYGEFTVID